MAHLDYKGPENLGSKAGRKLGKCRKNEKDIKATGELGKGKGERRHSGGGKGRGKRLKYNLKVYEMS
ncbi:DUF5320 family protein [Ancylomarina sp. YFZ004]